MYLRTTTDISVETIFKCIISQVNYFESFNGEITIVELNITVTKFPNWMLYFTVEDKTNICLCSVTNPSHDKNFSESSSITWLNTTVSLQNEQNLLLETTKTSQN